MPNRMKAGLDEAVVEGRRVLLRVDFNTPLTPGGAIRDDSRIRACLPTISELLSRGAAVVLVTHLGRPQGRVDAGLSTHRLAEHLELLLGREVRTCPEVVGAVAARMARELGPGELMMLENVRFRPEEEANDPSFAAELAALADVFVNDAFGTAHRAHASTEGVAHLLPAYAGRLMAKELEQLGRILDQPARPLLAIMGGSKLSTKLGVISHLLPTVDEICLGGAMAATFLKASGGEVGQSMVEDHFLEEAARITALAQELDILLELPVDAVTAPGLSADASQVHRLASERIPKNEMMLDIGSATVARWVDLIGRAATVVWNGPLGVYENPLFSGGTRAVAEAIAASHAVSITGGGDLQAAIDGLGLTSAFTHVSTGGGATLEFLEGRDLPGVVALLDASDARGASS